MAMDTDNNMRPKPSRGKKVKPIRETEYGKQLLHCVTKLDEKSCGGAFEAEFVRAVASGDDYATVAGRFNISYEMAQYTVRRLLRRYDALLKLQAGLTVLREREADLASAGLTDTQREALLMLLAGRSQAYVASALQITQAAVSSRLRLASKFLEKVVSAEGQEWTSPLAEAVRVRRSRNTLTSFQRKAKGTRD